MVEEDDRYVKSRGNRISLYTSNTTAQLCAISKDFANYRGILCHALTDKQWFLVLSHCVLTFDRILVAEGEVIPGKEDKAADRDMFVTIVTKVAFDKVFVEKVNRLMDDAWGD